MNKEPSATTPRDRWWRRLRVTVLWAVIVFVVLAAAGGGYAVWTVRRSFPAVDATLTVPGLRDRVEVRRDRHGIPQIYAANAHDLFLAQGFVHSQDRFWEMDVRRHITAGRVAELFGPAQVATDTTIRTLGWYRVAQEELKLLDQSTVEYLGAYADGVNAYLRDRSSAQLSVEYALLGLNGLDYTPQPWTPADSLAWFKAMAWTLNGTMSDQLQHALLGGMLSKAQIDSLFPEYDFTRWRAVVGPEGSSKDTPVSPVSTSPQQVASADPGPALRATAAALDRFDALLGPRGQAIGSNSWAVSGARSATGAPLLANDPHLVPSMPGVWHQVGLHCTAVTAQCPFDVAGFGFAGVPGIIIGHNADIAWGLTNLGAADTDLFLEKISGDSYEDQGRMVPVITRQEQIRASDGSTTTITVRATRHGPIISDAVERVHKMGVAGKVPGVPQVGGGYAVTMRWTALEPGRTMAGIFGMNRARDWHSFRVAAALFAAPGQNLVYADRAGHIGYQASGLVPIRKNGDGRMPVPGWTGEYDWTGYLPFDALPSALDPASGYVVTANNAVVDGTYPHLITKNWGDGYRSQRIIELIEQAGKLDTAAMQRIQGDTYNANAATLTPYLLKVTPGADAVEAQNLLRDWDFTQPADAAAPAYFNAVWRNLLKLCFAGNRIDPSFGVRVDGGGRWFEVVRNLLARPADDWWRISTDPRELRNRDDVLRAAMDDAAAELRQTLGEQAFQWRWGALHQLTLRNETLGTGAPVPVEWLLNRGPVEVGGGYAAVDATGWHAGRGYAVEWVPSMRMVVDLSTVDASRWINLTGASGHACHDNYDDQVELWRRNETLPWSFTRDAVNAATRHTLTLQPG